ncbi:hypothetical protein YTPLAS18_16450 [Nitrospira sp.]|nr:hypothetical protein YTPLAS18_16450 [Nitrospira sp.]
MLTTAYRLTRDDDPGCLEALSLDYWSSLPPHGAAAGEQEMDTDNIQRRVTELSWIHILDLGNGIITP